ncbi:DUF2199 domain-containing protein [Bradyrhizobium sp. U531]|uniref:DUF2199 domain-containing protein n=1 Tax=Bradyrhizobium sp. U531 TaxID=3053458 RepID=UPI003F422A84
MLTGSNRSWLNDHDLVGARRRLRSIDQTAFSDRPFWITSRNSENMFRFKCSCCDEWHEGMPGYSADAPLYFYAIPADERAQRCALDADTCIVDDEYFFARGCLEIPVHGASELPLYPRTENLKTRLHLRNGFRPYIELEPTDHPLALEQRLGISVVSIR